MQRGALHVEVEPFLPREEAQQVPFRRRARELVERDAVMLDLVVAADRRRGVRHRGAEPVPAGEQRRDLAAGLVLERLLRLRLDERRGVVAPGQMQGEAHGVDVDRVHRALDQRRPGAVEPDADLDVDRVAPPDCGVGGGKRRAHGEAVGAEIVHRDDARLGDAAELGAVGEHGERGRADATAGQRRLRPRGRGRG